VGRSDSRVELTTKLGELQRSATPETGCAPKVGKSVQERDQHAKGRAIKARAKIPNIRPQSEGIGFPKRKLRRIRRTGVDRNGDHVAPIPGTFVLTERRSNGYKVGR